MWQASGKPKFLTKGIFDPKIGKKVDFFQENTIGCYCQWCLAQILAKWAQICPNLGFSAIFSGLNH